MENAHPLVRDLAWLLDAPDLLAMPWPGRPSLVELGLEGERRQHFLDEQQTRPQRLKTRVGDGLRGRMGHYHERLWQHLIDTAPGTRLLVHNRRIERDRRTLGEVDLIYQRLDDGKLVHLEVAIKFYLGLDEGPGNADDQARWIGPGCVDSLATKRQRLHHHQLPLLDHIRDIDAMVALLGDPKLAERALSDGVERRLALPGALFYPFHSVLEPPHEATADHLRGTWLAWSHWPTYRTTLGQDTRGAWLSKPHWMAPPPIDHLQPIDRLHTHLKDHFATGANLPVPVILHDERQHWRRLFVVPDDWPRHIPLPP